MIAEDGRSVIHGIIGTVTPVLGVITSFQEQLEWGMRILSLSIGIIVGLMSLIKFLKNR